MESTLGNEVHNLDSFIARVFVVRRAAMGRRCSLVFLGCSCGSRAQLCNLRSKKTLNRESGLSAIEPDGKPD